MVQVNQPTYNAVRINITKPSVELDKNNKMDNNAICNGVDINVEEPSVKSAYDYPNSKDIITYDMTNFNRIPVTFPISYQTTNVIVPKTTINSEIEFDIPNQESEFIPEELDIIDIPEPNFTTLEIENKAPETIEITEMFAEEIPADDEPLDAIENSGISFRASSVKTPEIIPGEDIKPDVDIPLVISNLKNPNFDTQAQQMEEIARLSLENSDNAIPYIVREVFANLIDITKKDTTSLEAPSEKQIQARRKMIANSIILENAKLNGRQNETKLPYAISEEEIAIAMEISPMEQAERNKEYALYTMAILARVYTDEIEKHTGNVVPLTDIPGASAIVDALRYNPNSGVKIAAIDALKYIQRQEYNEELTTLFTLAQADQNPEVSISATRALSSMNN